MLHRRCYGDTVTLCGNTLYRADILPASQPANQHCQNTEGHRPALLTVEKKLALPNLHFESDQAVLSTNNVALLKMPINVHVAPVLTFLNTLLVPIW